MKFGSMDRLILFLAGIIIPLALVYGMWKSNALSQVVITAILLIMGARFAYWVYQRH